MVLKKVDDRVRLLIEEATKTRQRALVCIFGDHGDKQVPNLYQAMETLRGTQGAAKNVLWVYKEKPGLSSNTKKRNKELKQLTKKGEVNEQYTELSAWMKTAKRQFVKYSETESVLGQTFDMLVLQDFESLTPNAMCRTMETVRGGGLVVLLFKGMTDVQALHQCTVGEAKAALQNSNIKMDAHRKYRSDGLVASQVGDVVGRFNSRMFVSFADVKHSLFMDDEMNIIPLNDYANVLQKMVSDKKKSETHSVRQKNLTHVTHELKVENNPKWNEIKALCEVKPEASPEEAEANEILMRLVDQCATPDQARIIMKVHEELETNNINSTISVMAARGRGKSAAMGIALGAALKLGFTNVMVSAPHPSNVATLFEFAVKSLKAFGYSEGTDFVVESKDLDKMDKYKRTAHDGRDRHTQQQGSRTTVVGITLKTRHVQKVIYQDPEENFAPADLIVLDECAAIPLTTVKSILENKCMALLSSTVYGYEGTGRALSLKLLSSLGTAQASKALKMRTHTPLSIEEPIRYALNDPIEAWLSDLLCLDCVDPVPLQHGHTPQEKWNLYEVNRDVLFSGNKLSEVLLRRIMSLFVSSHYKNSPDDLMLLSDSPTQRLYMICPDLREAKGIPDVYGVVQGVVEGHLAKSHMKQRLGQDKQGDGNLIPWTLTNVYNDGGGFGELIGMRVQRIAVHPSMQRRGVGTALVSKLESYLKLSNDTFKTKGAVEDVRKDGNRNLFFECCPSSGKASRTFPFQINWFGTSFGLTESLFDFWCKDVESGGLGFQPVHVKDRQNRITGEHSAIMIRQLDDKREWLDWFHTKFRQNLTECLPELKLKTLLALRLLDSDSDTVTESRSGMLPMINETNIHEHYTLEDVEALNRFLNPADNPSIASVKYIVPRLARHYFNLRLDVSPNKMNKIGLVVLTGVGLQNKSVAKIASELSLSENPMYDGFNQMLSTFAKVLNDWNTRNLVRVVKRGPEAAEQPQAKRQKK